MPPLPQADLEHVLSYTKGIWEDLRGAQLFITGGTGFFGAWLTETFLFANEQLGLGAQAVLLSRDPDRFLSNLPHLADQSAITFHPGDVREFPFPEGDFSHVIHAATTSSAPVPPSEMFDTILNGTRRVLDFAEAAHARKLLLISSGAVYGKQPADLDRVPEDYAGAPNPLDPASAYGEGKRAAELLCATRNRTDGLETKIARCFAFVGPHLPLDAHFAAGNFIRDALKGGPIRVNGDGTPVRSYLYAADLAIWLWTILVRGAGSRAYNVGSDESVTIADLASAVSEVLETGVALPSPQQAGSPASRYVPDVQRASQELGLRPVISLKDAIRRTGSWLRSATD